MQRISLIIPAYNEEKYIGACLESVQKNGTELFEVIVVSNGSTDKTVQIVRNFSFVRLIEEPVKGLPAARQRGLDEARGDIVAFIDADARVPDGWVKKIMQEFEKYSEIVGLSGPYFFYDGSFLTNLSNVIFLFVFIWPSYFFTRSVLIAGNFAVRKEAFYSVGGFDTTIAFYGDDTDIARRLSDVGRVKFSQKLYMYSSARRLKSDGIIQTGFHYGVNFVSMLWKGRPHTEDHSDIR